MIVERYLDENTIWNRTIAVTLEKGTWFLLIWTEASYWSKLPTSD